MKSNLLFLQELKSLLMLVLTRFNEQNTYMTLKNLEKWEKLWGIMKKQIIFLNFIKKINEFIDNNIGLRYS